MNPPSQIRAPLQLPRILVLSARKNSSLAARVIANPLCRQSRLRRTCPYCANGVA